MQICEGGRNLKIHECGTEYFENHENYTKEKCRRRRSMCGVTENAREVVRKRRVSHTHTKYKKGNLTI